MPLESKKASYPSRQIRGGPAPLASFEDLSDAISESPEDDEGPLRDDDPDDYDSRTYSDGATPSTPRVLAQTPSTPLALDSFSIGTPDSLGNHSNDLELTSRPETPTNSLFRQEANYSRGSSPRMSPILSGRHWKTTTPDPGSTDFHHQLSATDNTKPSKKSVAGTPSPRSARKLFTMSFFKPREDKSPSPMISPKSPRRLSPSALSPKSPRKTTFGGLFRSKDTTQEIGSDYLAVGGCGTGLPSPTKKKSHFANFLRPPKEDKKQDGSAVSDHSGRKEGGGRYAGVFAHLFRRADAGTGRSAVSSSSSSDKRASPMAHTPEDEEWSVSKVQATSSVQHSTLPSTIVEQVTGDAVPSSATPERFQFSSEEDRMGALVDDSRIFESSHDIADAVQDNFDPKLRLGLSPSNDSRSGSSLTLSLDPLRDTKPDLDRLALKPVRSTTEGLSADRNKAKEDAVPTSPAPVVTCVATLSVNDKMSPESEVEAPEADPAILKTLKGDEPEAETLLREDSFEIDDFGTEATSDGTDGSKMVSGKELIPRHRDKIARFRMNPVDRPRSTAPVSFSSLEAYINIVAHQPPAGGQSAVVAVATSTSGHAESAQGESNKLKVVLPGEEFEHKLRQGKKPVYKSWIEFCEVGLQSPRSRRRQMVGERASSAPSDSSTRTFHKTSTRSSSVVERRKLAEPGFSASSDAWVTFEASPVGEVRHPKKRQFSSRSLPHPRRSSSSSSRSSSPPPHLRSLDGHSLDAVLHNGRDALSSENSSRSNSPNLEEAAGLKTLQDDEEVEPLVGDSAVDINSSVDDQFGSVPVLRPQLFFGESQFVPVQSSLDDWTLSDSEDVGFQRPSVVVPDCVASTHLPNKSSSVRGHGADPDADWFNGGIDLLASIPSPLSKQPESPSVPGPLPPNPNPLPPPVPQRQAPSRRLPPPPPPSTSASVRGQHM